MFNKKHIPNIITLFRLLFCPIVIIYVIYLNNLKLISNNLSAFILLIIFLTDFFDGFLARKLNSKSYLGAMLDGLADKIIIYAIFLYYLAIGELNFLAVYLLIVRDLLVISLKQYSLEKKITLEVLWSAKLKFALECLMSFVLIYNFKKYNNLLMCFIIFIAWYSAIRYFLKFYYKFKNQEIKKNEFYRTSK